MVEKFKGYKNFNQLVDDGYLEEDYKIVNGSRLEHYTSWATVFYKN